VIEGIDYNGVEDRADSFAAAVFPWLMETIDKTTQEWLDEYTTLRGERKEQYGDVLKRRTLQKLAEKLTTKAATND
jgi:hypothetical protein